MIRLHEHAAILIASDEEALADLTAAQPLRPVLGPRLSPRVAWVDHNRLDALREALRQAGYTPRIVKDNGGSDGPQR